MKIKFTYVILIVAVAFVFSLVITAGDATLLDKLGIQGYYSQIEKFIPFALTPSANMSCELVQSIYFIDSNSNKRILSDFAIEEFIPSKKLDLTARSGLYTVKTLEGELKGSCASSSIINTVVSGGVITFQIFATNAKGETVKIIDTPYTTLTTASVDGRTAILAKWSISADSIESKIGKSATPYTTTITSNAIGTINLKESSTATQVWTYSIKHGVASAVQYKVISTSPTNNPVADLFSGLAKRKVELKLVNSDNAIYDIRKNNPAIISVIGSLYDWEESTELYPILKLYYTDPINSIPSESVTPKITKTLTSYKGKSGIGNVADFVYGFNLGNNPKLGEYKVTFSSALKDGKPIRDTVASITFQIIKTTATCEETKSCPDITDDQIISDMEPQPINDLALLGNCLKTGNIQCIFSNSGIPINIISGIVVFMVLLIIISIGIAIAKRPPRQLPRY